MAGWTLLAGMTHLIGGCAAMAIAVWLMPRRAKLGQAGAPAVAALTLSAAWALVAGASGTESAGAALLESFRNLAVLIVVWQLFATDGRSLIIRQVRPMIVALAAVELLLAAALVVLHRPLQGLLAQQLVFDFYTGFRLIVVIGGLVLLHNLYSGASRPSRLALRWPVAGFAALWLFDLNLYTVAWFSGVWPEGLASLRGLALAIGAMLVLPGLTRQRDELHFSPSRVVAFQFVSLSGIVAYFAVMLLATKLDGLIGPAFANIFQFGLLIAACALAVLLVPSKRLRSWLRVTLTKHLFRHRYDYRVEWLRFAGTIGRSGEQASPLEQRAIQAIAQITDSDGGLLLTAGDGDEFVLSASWQWASAEVPAIAMEREFVRNLERTAVIVELDAVREGKAQKGVQIAVPDWLVAEPRAWALVPLLHYERLAGVVVLARPPQRRALDWEDFDLLRVVGQQLATTLSEHAGQDALAEAARFDEFNRRIAFVMHDIKNLASQFGLLARNAEKHADNPEFRADMLVTLRNSADKLNALISRLSRYGAGSGEKTAQFDVAAVVADVARQFEGRHPVAVVQSTSGEVVGNRDALEQALVHIVQNAVDASQLGTPVFIDLTSDGLNLQIEVVDSGTGMSPEFVRTKLFKPFVSSKNGGFGIGACEARELIRAMKGRLDVESREGLGSRFIIRLPLSSTADMLSMLEDANRKVA